MKQTIATILLLIISIPFFGQHSVQGRVVSKQSGELVEMAAVRLMHVSNNDTILVGGAQTDGNGAFMITKVHKGTYLLIISMVGYKDEVRTIEIENKDKLLGSIKIEENIEALSEVEVRGTAVEMVVRGDTMEYNATAYKTAEDAMAEELLKKMPGVEVDKEGNVTVNGESVKSIKIDGKKFFGSDVQTATKNIPAEMIDKVQVIDEKSEMAKLTGFEDDDTERIINFTLKKSKKKGLFGNYTGGLGADLVADNGKWFGYDKNFMSQDFRYNANAFTNILLGESQTTILGSANNINELRSGRGRGGLQGSNGGITWAENIGVNTNIDTKKNLLIGGDVQMNHANNLTTTETEKESYANQLTFNNYDKQRKLSNGWDVNMRVELEWKIDSLNKLVIQPKLSYTNTWSNSTKDYTYLREKDTVTIGEQKNEGIKDEIGAGLKIIYNKKFLKKGRSLTTNVNLDFSNTNSDSYNYSLNNYVGTDESISSLYTTATNVDQHTLQVNNGLNYSAKISYVEPLYNKEHFLETAFTFSGSSRTAEKNQYNKDADGEYTAIDSTYSSNYENQYFSEALEVNYQYVQPSFKLTAGMKINPSQTISRVRYLDSIVNPTENYVWNVSPTLNFKYKFGKKEFARINYRGTSVQPSISQMQPVRNNDDAMNMVVGNQRLNPAFRHTLRLMYSKYNEVRFSSVSAGLRGNLTKDALVSNTIYDLTGKRYQQTVNANSLPFDIGGDLMYNTPIVKNRLHFNTRTSLSYNQRIAYLSKEVDAATIDMNNMSLGALSRTGNLQAAEDLSLRFTHDIVDIGAQGNVTYSRTQNSLTENKISNVVNWSVRADATFHLPYNWTISTDIGYTARYGYQLDNVNEVLWNASIDKSWQQMTLSLKVYDLLNQRKNIVQEVGEDYVKYSKYNTLPTYFMLSFTYKLNRMGDLKAKGKAAKMQEMLESSGTQAPNLPQGPPPDGVRPLGPPPER